MISNKWTPEDYRTPAIEQKSVSGKAVSLDNNKKCWHKKKNALKARLSVTRNSYFDAFTADTFYLMATRRKSSERSFDFKRVGTFVVTRH